MLYDFPHCTWSALIHFIINVVNLLAKLNNKLRQFKNAALEPKQWLVIRKQILIVQTLKVAIPTANAILIPKTVSAQASPVKTPPHSGTALNNASRPTRKPSAIVRSWINPFMSASSFEWYDGTKRNVRNSARGSGTASSYEWDHLMLTTYLQLCV